MMTIPSTSCGGRKVWWLPLSSSGVPRRGFGDAAESRRPLGVVAVGGMVTSTLLTLFVIPVIYTLFAHFGKKRTIQPREVDDEG